MAFHENPNIFNRHISISLKRCKRTEKAVKDFIFAKKQKELCCICGNNLSQTENPTLTQGQLGLFIDLVLKGEDPSGWEMSTFWVCVVCLGNLQQLEIVKCEVLRLEKQMEGIIQQLRTTRTELCARRSKGQSKDNQIKLEVVENRTISVPVPTGSCSSVATTPFPDNNNVNDIRVGDENEYLPLKDPTNSADFTIKEEEDCVEDVKPIILNFSRNLEELDGPSLIDSDNCGAEDDDIPAEPQLTEHEPQETTPEIVNCEEQPTEFRPKRTRQSKINAEKQISSMIQDVEDENSKDDDQNDASFIEESYQTDSDSDANSETYSKPSNQSKMDPPTKKKKKKGREFPKCIECGAEFANGIELRRHIIVEHTDRKKEVCDICQKSVFQLRIHKEMVHEQLRPHKCHLCGKGYYKMNDLWKHLESKKHNPDKKRVGPYICKTCGEGYASRISLKGHRRLVCNGDERIRCPHVDCNRLGKKSTFITEANLQEHMKHFHPENPEDKMRCGICNETFRTIQEKFVHNRRIHEKAFDCKFCNKTFFGTDQMKSHERTHTGERPYLCTGCGNSFRQHWSLVVHLQVSSCNPDKVEAERIRKLRSKKQMEWRANKKALKLKCLFCTTTFLSKERLLRHTSRFHPDEKQGDEEPTELNVPEPSPENYEVPTNSEMF